MMMASVAQGFSPADARQGWSPELRKPVWPRETFIVCCDHSDHVRWRESSEHRILHNL